MVLRGSRRWRPLLGRYWRAGAIVGGGEGARYCFTPELQQLLGLGGGTAFFR